MKLSLSDAASRAGVSKATLWRAVKAGKISAERDGRDYRIDAAELARVYPISAETHAAVSMKHDEAALTGSEIRVLAAENTLLRERVAELAADKEDLRRRLDAAEAERRTLLQIADQRARPGWFARLVGRGG